MKSTCQMLECLVHSKWSEVKWSHSVVSNSLRPHRLYPTRLLCPWDFPGNTGVDCHFLLQGIFPTQGSNPGLPHCWLILYHLSCKGSPHFTYKWAVMDDQGLRLSSSSFLCLSKREKGKGNTLIQRWMSAEWTLPFWMWDHLEIQASSEPCVAWDRMQVVTI